MAASLGHAGRAGRSAWQASLEQRTEAASLQMRRRWLEAIPPAPPAEPNRIVFLGTGGNPVNLVTQRRRTAGFYVHYSGVRMYVDPGPGAIVEAVRRGLPLPHLDAVFISHGHTDHYLGAGAIIEAMCRTMSERRGLLLAPASFLARGGLGLFHQGRDPSPGYPGGPDVRPLRLGEEVALGPLRLRPVPAHHGPENYGFFLQGPGLALAYTSDSAYIRRYRGEAGEMECRPGEPLRRLVAVTQVHEDLHEALAPAEIVVANVSFFHAYPARHFTVLGVRHLAQTSARLRRAILTHFDASVADEDLADEMAAFVAHETGKDVVAARDGMEILL